jgi:hypothetical protein
VGVKWPLASHFFFFFFHGRVKEQDLAKTQHWRVTMYIYKQPQECRDWENAGDVRHCERTSFLEVSRGAKTKGDLGQE